jgi:GntP family gluconate:H+ symporter
MRFKQIFAQVGAQVGTLGGAIPHVPLVIWMIVITLLIGLFADFSAKEIIAIYNEGWGYAAGEFALILLPSFLIAASLERQSYAMPPAVPLAASPVISAGMICPDTAYAALTPMVPRQKISLALSVFSGFKLLFPAGPLIVATGLGAVTGKLFLTSFLVFLPVFATGLIYAHWVEGGLLPRKKRVAAAAGAITGLSILRPTSLFVLLFGLLIAGFAFNWGANSWLDFATNPKGALIITAIAAMGMVAGKEKRGCIDDAIRQTASLLLIIGAASAFSRFITEVVDVEALFTRQHEFFVLLSLFGLAALFKILQGSSMATFAAAGPVALPVVEASSLSPTLAVLALCLGSFIAILPNDSFYWLVKQDAMRGRSDLDASGLLAGGSLLQALVGLILLLGLFVVYP